MRWWVAGILALSLLSAGRVSAQSLPVVVVVEGTEAEALRAAISRGIEAPVVSLTDADAAHSRGTLSIRIDGAEATFLYEPKGHRGQLVRVPAPAPRAPILAWVPSAAVALVRATESGPTVVCQEVLDPWFGEPETVIDVEDPYAGRSEVLDPFVDLPSARYVRSEVIDPFDPMPRSDDEHYRMEELQDPWRPRARQEGAAQLSPPRPTPR